MVNRFRLTTHLWDAGKKNKKRLMTSKYKMQNSSDKTVPHLSETRRASTCQQNQDAGLNTGTCKMQTFARYKTFPKKRKGNVSRLEFARIAKITDAFSLVVFKIGFKERRNLLDYSKFHEYLGLKNLRSILSHLSIGQMISNHKTWKFHNRRPT